MSWAALQTGSRGKDPKEANSQQGDEALSPTTTGVNLQVDPPPVKPSVEATARLIFDWSVYKIQRQRTS